MENNERDPLAEQREVSVYELKESWINGNLSTVIGEVCKHPPHIAALLTMVLERDASPEEANRFVNLLMDHCRSTKYTGV
jgi:hypothetical protein